MITKLFGEMSGCGGEGRDSERGTEAVKLSIEKEKEAFVKIPFDGWVKQTSQREKFCLP